MAVLPSWSSLLTAVLSFTTLVLAYRPVQHCKALGDNGHYSACTAITQYYNQSSGESDLYVRYNWYKYKESKNGWHAFALGHRMAGALMFIFYGDPTRPSPELTISVRSADGHHPPQMIHDMDKFNSPAAEGRIPAVDIVTQTFQVYNGPYQHPTLNLKPTHVGIAEFIVRGYAKWIGDTVSNTTSAQPMLWSSRYDQDFEGDYRIDHNIDMHAFGLGFGFMYVDVLNAETSVPMFGPIDELASHLGLVEAGEPKAPTAAELSKGEFLIANANTDPSNVRLAELINGGSSSGSGSNKDTNNPFSDHENTTPSTVPNTNPDAEKEHSNNDNNPTTTPANSDTSSDPESKPTFTIKGKTIRDWMWHLHGFLLSLAFFLLYPLGIYLLRSPKNISSGLSFNYHWTVQSLATVVFAIGCFIGYFQSRSISVTHQYIGITIVCIIGTQMVLGWRHHVKFLQVKRKTLLSRVHVGLGRVVLPLGFVNVLSGMKLRGYGWFTMLLVLVLVVIEVVFGAVYLRQASVRRAKMGGAAVAEELKAQGPGVNDDEEEYFQLAAAEDDEDDESESDDDGRAKGEAAAERRREEKRKENERLAKLDRV